MNELPDGLERALRRLDGEAARSAARVSPERVAARVAERLRAEGAEETAARPWARSRRWVGLAAAAVLVLTVGTVAVRVSTRGAKAAVAVPVVARALDSLDVSGLESVLRETAEVRPQIAVPVAASTGGEWDDLTESQLRAVLQAVQQSEGGTL